MSVLSKFTTQLAESGKIQDDEPLVGIIEGLIGEFEVSTENLALLSGLKVDNIQAILNNPKSLEDSKKNARAMRMSYWNLVFANSRI